MSTAAPDVVDDDNDDTVVPPATFTALSRLLHWATALFVFTTLLVGFTMVSTTGDYSTLLVVHETLGAVILVVVAVRVVNRLTHRAPALPGSVGRVERAAALGSELALYGLLVAQPLIGWAMVSATGIPLTVFGGVVVPRIAPVDASLYAVLREAHSVLAWLFVVVIAAHVTAILMHAVVLRDGMLRRMTFRGTRRR